MSLNRRQFLLLSGTAGGVGLALLGRRLFAQGGLSSSFQSSTRTSTAQPSKTSDEIGPKGVFAPKRGDVRLAVISDLNSQYGATDYQAEVIKAISLLPEWKPDIVLCGGDMVAGQSPSLSEIEIKAMWAAFDRNIAAPLRQAKLPFGFTIGNHDASGALAISGKFLYANERKLATAYWQNPKHDPGLQFVDRTGFPFYYTFQHNQIFYLIWDASSNLIPQAQLAWAERALASQTAQDAKLRIAIGHLPLYAVAVGRDDPGEVLANTKQLQGLLERYQVHTYISGHDHAYYPAHQGKLELLHTGALGGGPRPWLNSNLAPEKTLTIVDVNLTSASTVYTTYNMATLTVFDQKKLPRLIVGPSGRVLRRDVALSDLTAAEQALTWIPSR
jgi:3',5'-cyclic AMP phosphodiesterase CpdA